jgi:L-asparaginase II
MSDSGDRMTLQAEVLVVRGAIAESRHRVQAVATNAAGVVRAATDDVSRPTSFRSAAKPFQLLPFVERGHAEALVVTDREIAIMTASHSGSRMHLDLVRGLLARIGLEPRHLACGYHDPMDAQSLEDLRLDPSLKSALYNNCSGKHAGMLAFCVAEGWPVEGYERPEHPLQQLLLRTVAECCGVDPATVQLGVDGCSLPVFGLPLTDMAVGYARFARAIARGGDRRAEALQRIGRAMSAHPVVVEGEGRLASDLMAATGGRIVAKSGAEGLLLVADPSREEGVAIKCEDGAMRALGPVSVGLLELLGTVTPAETGGLAAHRRTPVTNAAGAEVGYLEAHVSASSGAHVRA